MKKINKIAIASTTVALTSAIVGGCVAANIPTNVYGPPPSAEVNQRLPFDEEKNSHEKNVRNDVSNSSQASEAQYEPPSVKPE